MLMRSRRGVGCTKKNEYLLAAEDIWTLPRALKNNPSDLNSYCIPGDIAEKIEEFMNSNEELVGIFLKMGNLEDNVFKCKAYWRASDTLKTLPDKIEYGYQVRNLDGFGKSICAMIDEFRETGTVKRLDEMRSQPPKQSAQLKKFLRKRQICHR